MHFDSDPTPVSTHTTTAATAQVDNDSTHSHSAAVKPSQVQAQEQQAHATSPLPTTASLPSVTATATAPSPPPTQTTTIISTITPLSSTSSPNTSSTTTITSAPSHKRGREPSAMTDPSEAARYTPPREMFRQELDDNSSQPTVSSVQENDTEIEMDDATPQHALQHDGPQPDGFHGDAELDNLGQQLSIHSPEKTAHASTDLEDPSGPSADFDSTAVLLTQGPQRQKQMQEHQGPSTVPSFSDQLDTIRNLIHKRLEENDPWYLVNKVWYARFRKYCIKMNNGGDAEHPGPIDNSVLFQGDALKPDLQHSVETVPQEGWDKLVAWYGTSTAPIMRLVVNTGSPQAPNLMIDYYPPTFTLYRVVESSQVDNHLFAMNVPDTLEVSRSTKFGNLKMALISTILGGVANPKSTRLWAIPKDANLAAQGNVIGANAVLSLGATCLDNLEDDAALAEIPELVRGCAIALEVGVNGSFPVPYAASEQGFSLNMPMSFPRSLQGARGFASSEAPVDGICGLSNLGNTCFMNSALQCLSNTPDLTRYILAGAWRDELNRDNPLGMGGEVARAYANLIDKLWKGTNKVFSPREFKSTIGRFAPSFTGYHQHDSQELLAFLLDGLHEDLNRIIKKPYTEVPDFSGRPDEEVAADCWKLHKARNDSIIVDLFQGQYKSTLVCPECHKISVTFDPFMYLSLPLPISKKWVGTVTYVPYDPKQPIVDIRLQLPKGSTQRVLKERVAELMNTQASHLYSAEVFANRFYKTHENGDVVDELSDTDKTFLYELPVPDFTNAQDHVVFPVLSMMEPTSSFGRISTFGHPMMVCVTKEEALDPDAVYKAILKQYSRYTTMDLYEDDTAESGERTKTDEQSADVDMTTPDDTKEERMAKSGLFRLLAFPPPPSQPSRYQYRPMTKPTMYAPSVPPSMNDMIDMYQRVLSKESGTSKEMDIFKSRHGQSWGDDNEDDSMNRIGRLGSPSGLSNSSRSSSRPRVPQPDQDELSEDEGEQSILQSRRPNFATASPSIPVCEPEPAVRKGEMVYCVWARPYESSIYAPERRYRSYRSMEEEETQESGVRVLWEQRGPPVVDPVLQEEIAANKKGRKVITLEDCLNEYTKEEQLGQEDLWYCPNCKKHQQATKKLDIWRFPDILVVHLKRFSHTRAWRDKIDAMVDFPIEGLDLSTKTLKENNREDNIYDLFGVSNHMGGLGGGHYTAYAKNEKLNQWYSFDDSHVSPVNKEAIKTSSAYLLFYRRRSAVLPEYEQRPASPVAEPSVQSISATPYYNYSVYSGPSDAPSSSLWRSELEEGQYGPWGKPPSETYDEYGPMPPAFFDDTDLPEYNSTIGASGMASPPSPFSEGLTFVSDKRNGKSRSRNDDNDADDEDSTMAVSYLDDPTAHSPDLSTCASDGSNPGTATVSPGFSPLAHATTIGEYPPRMQLPPHITLEDGRIDDSDEGAELPMRLYENIGTVGASIPTPSSTTIEGTEEAAGEEEESEQDGVQMVEWRKGSSDH